MVAPFPWSCDKMSKASRLTYISAKFATLLQRRCLYDGLVKRGSEAFFISIAIWREKNLSRLFSSSSFDRPPKRPPTVGWKSLAKKKGLYIFAAFSHLVLWNGGKKEGEKAILFPLPISQSSELVILQKIVSFLSLSFSRVCKSNLKVMWQL